MTDLSSNLHSCADQAREAVTIIACGALGPSVREIARRRQWNLTVKNVPSLLHNYPSKIAGAVEAIALEERQEGNRVALAYADCGTYGALDELCGRLGIARLGGLSCYEVFAGADRLTELFAEEPGTYLLTDFLIQTFRKSVLAELGLDRYPELIGDYFRHYRRIVWIAQEPTEKLSIEAEAIASLLGLQLFTIEAGCYGLEMALENLVEGIGTNGDAMSIAKGQFGSYQKADAR